MALAITWYGGQCLLAEEKERGEEARGVLFFPHTKTSRVRTLEAKAQIIVTEPKAPKTPPSAFRIETAGEYDVHRFMVRGVRTGDEAVFVLDTGSMTLAYVTGSPGRGLKEEEIEAIGTIDLLVVPAPFADGKDSTQGLGEFVRSLEPNAVTVMASQPKLRKAVAGELGVEGTKTTKLAVTRKDLPDEGFALYFLEEA